MTKLSDTQLVILSAACQRPDRDVLPLPANLKGGAAQKVIGSLLAKGLLQEVPTEAGAPVWREHDGNRLGLIATGAAFGALGIEPENIATEEAHTAAQEPHEAGDGKVAGEASLPPAEAAKRPRVAKGKPAAARTPRADTKQAQLIAMLQRSDGASLSEIVAATGWQTHTVRGAIAGALKKKLGLEVRSEKADERGRIYRILA